jgi:hypothetical protein
LKSYTAFNLHRKDQARNPQPVFTKRSRPRLTNNEPKSIIEITLSDKFCVNENEDYLKLLFSNEKATGGCDIHDMKYMPDKLKAYVKFEDVEVAKRVESKRFIEYNSYKFIVRFTESIPTSQLLVEVETPSNSTASLQPTSQRFYSPHDTLNKENNDGNYLQSYLANDSPKNSILS